ncbi:MAG: permease [Actinomycetota bacterium]
MSGKAAAASEAGVKPWRKRIRWDWAFLLASIPAFVVLTVLFREDEGAKAAHVSWEYFKEMAIILPAVLIIMGLVTVWVERDLIVRFLGEGSGLTGIVLSFILGSIPMGPLYIAFPLAYVLLKKGARVANVVIFLSAWACIKLPIELVEFQFMGWKFALTRYVSTLVVVAMSLAVEKLFFARGWEVAEEAEEHAEVPEEKVVEELADEIEEIEEKRR